MKAALLASMSIYVFLSLIAISDVDWPSGQKAVTVAFAIIAGVCGLLIALGY